MESTKKRTYIGDKQENFKLSTDFSLTPWRNSESLIRKGKKKRHVANERNKRFGFKLARSQVATR